MEAHLVQLTPQILTAYARWSIAARDALEADREERQAQTALADPDINSATRASNAWDDLDHLRSQSVEAARFLHRMELELAEAVTSVQTLPNGVDGEDVRVDIERQLMA